MTRVAAACAAWFFVTSVIYAVFVLTRTGQYIDASAFVVSGMIGPGGQTLLAGARIMLIVAPTVAAVVIGISALRRREVKRVILATTLVAISFAVSRVAKDLLPRPVLGNYAYAWNTLPSGHVAVTTALVVACLILWPPRSAPYLRPAAVATVVGACLASTLTYAHRPSDVLAGALIAAGISALLAPITPTRAFPWSRTWILVAALLAVAALGLLGGLWLVAALVRPSTIFLLLLLSTTAAGVLATSVITARQ